MRRFRIAAISLASLVSYSACASGKTATVSSTKPGAKRFVGQPLVFLTDSMIEATNPARRFEIPPPRDEIRKENVIVAYVIDTLGRIEMPTISFLSEVHADLKLSICRNLAAAKFVPYADNEGKKHVLTLTAFGLLTHLQERPKAIPRPDFTPYRTPFHTQSHEASIARLNAAPHCK